MEMSWPVRHRRLLDYLTFGMDGCAHPVRMRKSLVRPMFSLHDRAGMASSRLFLMREGARTIESFRHPREGGDDEKEAVIFTRLPRLVPGLWGRLLLLAVCCQVILGAESVAVAAVREDEAGKIAFNIPPQPLGSALFAYTQATGADVFVDDALVVGRRSATVQGAYDRPAALRKLLAGNGLEIRRAAGNAFTVVAASVPEPPPDRQPGWSSDLRRVRFYAALQTTMRHVLCTQPDARPGLYRAALAIWLDPAGTVARVRLLSPNVGDEIGQALLAGMRGISVGQPPPAGLVQPVTFVILPRTPDFSGDCAAEMVESN